MESPKLLQIPCATQSTFNSKMGTHEQPDIQAYEPMNSIKHRSNPIPTPGGLQYRSTFNYLMENGLPNDSPCQARHQPNRATGFIPGRWQYSYNSPLMRRSWGCILRKPLLLQ
ncbi:hypothetical protein M8J76_006614 [Diaphorina citri]|nr:hypothetical protein M8J76_006614 [Diaphorina citri]